MAWQMPSRHSSTMSVKTLSHCPAWTGEDAHDCRCASPYQITRLHHRETHCSTKRTRRIDAFLIASSIQQTMFIGYHIVQPISSIHRNKHIAIGITAFVSVCNHRHAKTFKQVQNPSSKPAVKEAKNMNASRRSRNRRNLSMLVLITMQMQCYDRSLPCMPIDPSIHYQKQIAKQMGIIACTFAPLCGVPWRQCLYQNNPVYRCNMQSSVQKRLARNADVVVQSQSCAK